MTNRPGRAAVRRPRDARVRDRLLEAQQIEAEALAGVCLALDDLARTSAKRDAVMATATARVDEAQAAVESAQATLVEVSGLARAAQLLAMNPAALRKISNSRPGRRRRGDH